MSSSKLPLDFQTQMKRLLGEVVYEEFEKAIETEARTSIRYNHWKTIPPFENQTPIPWSENGYFLPNRPSFTLDPSFHAGAYYVQEASSMFIEHILKSQQVKKGIFLDLAAAPGGKSTLLSSYLGEDGFLVANEVIQARAQILRENCIKWGLGNILVSNNDPEHFEPLDGLFDLVLVDAPCSGEGMFRKDPQAREEWSPDHVHLCAARQKRIMDRAGALVKAGGYLIYSTCTFNELENEEMIRFLTNEFSYEPVRIPLDPTWKIVESKVETDSGEFYGYRFFPHLVEGEGFFITVLRRPELSYSLEPKKVKDYKHHFLKEIGPKEADQLDSELGFAANGAYYQLNESYFRINQNWKNHVDKLSQHLSFRYFGIEIGKKQGKDWIPSPAWALSILPKNNFYTIELSKEQALDFLRKADMLLPDLPKGWILVCYHSLPLGWIKYLGNRTNNYYPKEWRIRNL